MRPLAKLLLVLITLGARAAAAEPVTSAPRHVVMISVDGLKPESYLRADALGLKIPHLRQLMAEGAYGRVVGVLPTVTYPSHTTLITGVPPRIHGIESNRVFDPEGKSNDAWHWYASEVRVPTLVSAVRARHGTAAAVSWPVSVGMDADYLLAELWRPGSEHASDLLLLDALATPHLRQAVEAARGRPFPYPLTDDERTDTAVFLLRTFRPSLTLLHIFELDDVEHDFGPGTPQALAAIERSDERIGEVLAALDAAGIRDQTLVAVVSDHGFVPVATKLQPNTVLRDAGLLQVGKDGKITNWQVVFHADSGTTALVLRYPTDAALAERVRALFAPRLTDPASGLAAILDPAEIAALGGSASAALVLEAREGFLFGNGAAGSWTTTSDDKGAHGFVPTREELHASLLLAGPALARRGDLGVVPMTAIAPTLAAYLGVDLSPQADRPLPVLAGAGSP